MGSSDWLNKLNSLGSKPTYTSQYQSTIDDLMGKITNREKFSYDFNADPLYQQYKDNYTKLGNEASMNAVANASAMTGGYGNSYAVTAASQANQQYLQQLNGVIPELYNAAMAKYEMESQDLYNQYGMYTDAEDRNYGRYRDDVSDYYTDRDYYTNGYFNDRNFEYQKERDAISDRQWQQTFDYNVNRDKISDKQWQQNFDYNVSRDNVADSQWQKQFDYQAAQDALTQSNWERQFAAAQAARKSSGGSSGTKTSSTVPKMEDYDNRISYYAGKDDIDRVADIAAEMIDAGMNGDEVIAYISNTYGVDLQKVMNGNAPQIDILDFTKSKDADFRRKVRLGVDPYK